MPAKKKMCIGQNFIGARVKKIERAIELPHVRSNRLESNRLRNHSLRLNESPYQRKNRLNDMRQTRLEGERLRRHISRENETDIQHQSRIEILRTRASNTRQKLYSNLNLEAINYKKELDYWSVYIEEFSCY